MLSPEYLDGIAEPIQALYSELELRIIADIARRIAGADYVMTPSAEWQIYKLQQMGLAQEYINQQVAKTMKISEKTLNQIFKDAGIKSMKTDVETQKAAIEAGKLPKDTIPLSAAAALTQVINANAIRTHNTLKKLTGTIAIDVNGKINKYMDMCQLMVQSGAFTQQAAIDITVRKFAAEGVGCFDYASGVHTSIEAAVRRACITGVNQATAEVSLNNAQELDTDLVEVTSHTDARPDHAAWQGKVYSISGNSSKYRKLSDATGYGTGAGLCGWNCRHSFYAYIEGVSEQTQTKAELSKLGKKTVTYNGQALPVYEATQKLRGIERQIRGWKKQYVAMNAAGLPTADAALKIAKWRKIQHDFLDQTGLRQQPERELVVGFDKSAAQKVVWAKKKKVKEYVEEHVESVLTSKPISKTLSATAKNSDIIKSKAKFFTNRDEADKLFRPWTEAVWPKLRLVERRAAYEYTAGSGKFNRPLRGYDQSWSNFIGVGIVPLNNEGAEQMINDLMAAIHKVEIKEDVWLFRGSDQQSLAGLLGIDASKIIPSNVAALNKKFAGSPITDEAFFSTGISADAGFNNVVSYEVLVPSGTKGLYAEPFSFFGGTNTSGTWDGRQKASVVKGEAEVILQAKTTFRVREIKLVASKITVILEVIK